MKIKTNLKLLNNVIFMLFFILLFSCKNSTKAEDKKIEEEKMINLVSDLPLVKKHAKYLEKATNGKRHQIILVYSNPKENNGDYWIKVGEDNGTCFVSAYNFFVNPKNVKIKYLNVVSDSLIDVKDIKE